MGFLLVPLPHSHKEEDVKEVHRSQDEKDKADLGSEDFEDVLVIDHRFEHLQIEDNKAEVDEIESDDQQVIDAVG